MKQECEFNGVTYASPIDAIIAYVDMLRLVGFNVANSNPGRYINSDGLIEMLKEFKKNMDHTKRNKK